MSDYTLTLNAADAAMLRRGVHSKLTTVAERLFNHGDGPSTWEAAATHVDELGWLRLALDHLGWGRDLGADDEVTITADRDWLRGITFDVLAAATESLGAATAGLLYTAETPLAAVAAERLNLEVAWRVLDELGWPEIAWNDPARAAAMMDAGHLVEAPA